MDAWRGAMGGAAGANLALVMEWGDVGWHNVVMFVFFYAAIAVLQTTMKV